MEGTFDTIFEFVNSWNQAKSIEFSSILCEMQISSWIKRNTIYLNKFQATFAETFERIES